MKTISDAPRALAWIGLAVAGLVAALGTAWAFQRGGGDFDVFYAAWHLVLSGQPAQIYHATPDRFLYAPGFAWLLSPLALLPRDLSLALWCLLKTAALGLVLRGFSRGFRDPIAAAGWGAWGILLVARPLLVDFEYGQVNTLIMAVSCWALIAHVRPTTTSMNAGMAWALMGVAAVAKLFPLPLLAVPWLLAGGVEPARLRAERIGVIAGALAMFLAPLISAHGSDFFLLQSDWRDALLARGLPLESHNQSFIALLSHYFTASPTHVISEGTNWLSLGENWLSHDRFACLSLAWSFGAFGVALAWILGPLWRQELRGFPDESAALLWAAVSVALLVVPSHLVWKPYFVLGAPLGILAATRATWKILPWLALVFVGENLTGFDVLGHFWGPRFESASGLLLMHLVLIVIVARGARATERLAGSSA